MSKIDSFFCAHKMHPNQTDANNEISSIIKEMQQGLKGSKSSLMMIPTYIKMLEDTPLDKPVIAVDAGGTNMRVAVVTIATKGVLVEHFNKIRMPGSQGAVSKDEFYETVVDLVIPVLEYSDTISFCFSFPTEVLPNQDGKVVYMTKEVYIDGIEGTLLGENINEKLVKRGLAKRRVVVINDTVASMLSGLSHKDMKKHTGNAGFILGTGINSCYAEKIGNIETIDTSRMNVDDRMVINMESGGYLGFPVGTADKMLDQNSKDPGKYLFEKMCSGAYLGDLIYTTALLAAQEELFSEAFGKKLKAINTLTLWDVSAFIENLTGDNPIAQICDTTTDRENLLQIMDNLYHRIAKFSVILFAAIMKKSQSGTSKETPLAIVAEGTTFYKSPLFTKYLNKYTKELLNEQLGLHCSYLFVEDATLIGTAVAGLTPFL